MNRNLGIFLGAVALASAGVLVGQVLTDDDIASAAPRDFAIIRKGVTAKVDVVCITRVTTQDGGAGYDLTSQGSYTETSPADDGGTDSRTVSSSQAACSLSGAAEAAAQTFFNGAGLVCYRRGARLER